MSAARMRIFAAALGLAALALPAQPASAQTPLEAVHALDFFVHADLIQDEAGKGLDFWQQRLRRALAQANLALQGVQGQGADGPCCTRIEPTDPEIEFEVFGELGDGWSVLTSAADYDALKVAFTAPGVYIILSLEACGQITSTTIVGCADQGPDGGNHIVVDVVADDVPEPSYSDNLEGLGITIAHERGHNVGLAHSSSEGCLLMDQVVGGGCMESFFECPLYAGGATRTGAPCSCMETNTILLPPEMILIDYAEELEDGSSCSGAAGGVCSGGVCGDPLGDAGVSVFAVGDSTPGLPGEPLDQSPSHFTLSGLTGGWQHTGSPGDTGEEFTGLAHARSRGVTYTVGPGSGAAYRLVELDPQFNNVASEADLDCSNTSLDCAPITALAWNEDAGLLYGVEIDEAFTQQQVVYHESTLISIDPDTGVVSELGVLGSYFIPDGLTGLAYDEVTDRLYGASQADIIDIWGCSTSTACGWNRVAKTRLFESALTVDPASGRLYFTGRDGNGLTWRVVDPAAPQHFEIPGVVEPDFEVRIMDAAFGGLAALGPTPIPEPAATAAAFAVLASLALLARRRDRD